MTKRIDPSIIPVFPDLSFENALRLSGTGLAAGLDEAGRGAWAGPVTASAVILPCNAEIEHELAGVRDSKQLPPWKREKLAPVIQQHALAWAVGFASRREIDCIGILPATRLAMQRALESLIVDPAHLIIDALFLPEISLPQTSLIKGDQRSLSVAAASILAKTSRDAWMCCLDSEYPGYGFAQHKGYGTKQHQQALSTLGVCPEHRCSYAPVQKVMKKENREASKLV